MSGQPTRGVRPRPADKRGAIVPIPGPWRTWAGFVRHPVLPDRATLSPAPALKSVFALFGLDLALMSLLLGALSLALYIGFHMPEHVLGKIELKPGMIALIVIGAPIAEEIVFRGWLSGRIGHLFATPLTIVALLGFVGGGAMFTQDPSKGQTYLLVGVAAALLALLALFAFRRRGAIRFFQRHFAWFYWGSVLAFAGIHLSNFASAGIAALPLVLPQFMLAVILGYLRVNYGLWSSMLTHALHNTVFISLVLAGAG